MENEEGGTTIYRQSEGIIEKIKSQIKDGELANIQIIYPLGLLTNQTDMPELSRKIKRISEVLNSYYELAVEGVVTRNLKEVSDDREDEDPLLPLSLGLNTILYGPPGTGKTYYTQLVAKKTVGKQLLKQVRTKTQKFEDLKIYQCLIIILGDKTSSMSAGEVFQSEEWENSQMINGRTESNQGAINNVLSGIITEKYKQYFERNDKVAPATYKLTEKGQKLYEELALSEDDQTLEKSSNPFIEFITFHQSYGYEDFIEGIRANTTEDGEISYDIEPGVFLRFCRKAALDENNQYLFIIDEINRGNISKIFGELITLIEPSKRAGMDEELSVKLPYSKQAFPVPKNVYILGTMNTADRSIAMMDTALRRRFDFVELPPRPDLLEGLSDDYALPIVLESINNRIHYLYDRDHTIGHAFFLGAVAKGETITLSGIQQVFEGKIIPLLQEYFYDDYQKIQAVLNDTEGIYVRKKDTREKNLFTNDFLELLDESEDRYDLIANVEQSAFERFLNQVAGENS